MKEVRIHAYPFAQIEGTINVPDNLTENETWDYIYDNWNEVFWEPPELDYNGVEWEIVE